MFFATVIAFVGLLVVGLVVMLSLRRWVFVEAQVEDRLWSPETHKASYSVPEGQDPANLRAALAQAGFMSVMDRSGSRLLVECEESDRGQVREIISHVVRTGSEMHVGRVRFEDDA